MRDKDNYRYIPLDVLTTPQDEYVVKMNRWWLVEPTRGAMIYLIGNSYQCNYNKEVIERIRDDRELDIVFIPIAYLPRPNNF